MARKARKAGSMENVGEMVARWFICGLGARDAIPLVYNRRFMRVSVHWKDGTKWNVLCVPDFFPGEESIRPGAGHKIRHWRSSLAVGAEPVIARVRADRITLSGREGFPLSRWDLPRAA